MRRRAFLPCTNNHRGSSAVERQATQLGGRWFESTPKTVLRPGSRVKVPARVAELVYAPVSETGELRLIGVRLPSRVRKGLSRFDRELEAVLLAFGQPDMAGCTINKRQL